MQCMPSVIALIATTYSLITAVLPFCIKVQL